MTIELNCECGEVFFFQDKLAGRQIRCSSCGKTNVVPGAPSEPAPEEARPTPVPVFRDTQVRGLASAVNDEDMTPHLKATVGRVGPQHVGGGETMANLAIVTSTVGMIAILAGLGAVMIGTYNLIVYWMAENGRTTAHLGWGSSLVLLGLALGMGAGLLLVMLGILLKRWDAVLRGQLARMQEGGQPARVHSVDESKKSDRRRSRRSTG